MYEELLINLVGYIIMLILVISITIRCIMFFKNEKFKLKYFLLMFLSNCINSFIALIIISSIPLLGFFTGSDVIIGISFFIYIIIGISYNLVFIPYKGYKKYLQKSIDKW